MKIALDANCMRTKEEAHEYLKKMLNLPVYYGYNLDALYDCLTDDSDWEVHWYHYDDSLDHIRQIRRVMEEAGIKVTEM